MYLQDVQQSDVSSISFLPILSLVVFISTYSVGWGPLPWSVMGEMFSSNVKSKASGITVCVCWFLSFIITKFSDDLQTAFGNYLLYWVFGVFCVISVLFTILVLPETKGKSLQEIQDELNGVSPAMPEFGGKKWNQYYGTWGWYRSSSSSASSPWYIEPFLFSFLSASSYCQRPWSRFLILPRETDSRRVDTDLGSGRVENAHHF